MIYIYTETCYAISRQHIPLTEAKYSEVSLDSIKHKISYKL